MGLSLIKESFLSWLFPKREPVVDEEKIDIKEAVETLNELEPEQEEIPSFKSENIVYKKLVYLEQYIKIFSLTFPNEYKKYFDIIQNLKADYSNELKRYEQGFEGNITFSIDPEDESRRYVEVLKLESDIKSFVELEVDYKMCRDKFSKLCYRLNIFYNALMDTQVQHDIITNQLYNAYNSFEKLVNDLKEYEFFARDSRKKDDILNYIIYSDYIIFKSALRIGIVSNFSEYKQEISKIYSFFVGENYEIQIFNFFIESFEELQNLIVSSFESDETYEYVLKESQSLEIKLNDYNQSFNDYAFFRSMIKLENTLYGLIKIHNTKFTFDISKMIKFNEEENEVVSVNNTAKSILSLVGNNKSDLLEQIINKFNIEISWREFFFLCKIFELNDDVIKIADNTVFSMVKDKFLKLEEKYSEYSFDYIKKEKEKVLNYCGGKEKKYVLLFALNDRVPYTTGLLKSLALDFVIRNQAIYLNYSYFNGFKNLEKNFGQYVIF